MRPFRFLVPVALAALGGLAAGACGLPDVFRPAGLRNVVVRYEGSKALAIGERAAPVVVVEADGVPVPRPRLLFSSSDATVLALTLIGDTLVGCRTGRALLTIRLVSSMAADSTPTSQDSISVTGGGPPLAPCP